MRAKVVWFCQEKGYGFVSLVPDDGLGALFTHAQNVVGDPRQLTKGAVVEVEKIGPAPRSGGARGNARVALGVRPAGTETLDEKADRLIRELLVLPEGVARAAARRNSGLRDLLEAS